MKKTIITLLALAGVAGAESAMPQIWGGAASIDKLGASISLVTTNSSLSAVREEHIDNVWGNGNVTDRGTISFEGAYTVGENGAFTTASTGTGLTLNLIDLFDVNAGDVTLSFTANITAGSASSLLTFGETSEWCYHLGVDASGNLTGITTTGYTSPATDVSEAINISGEHDYVLSWASAANFDNSGSTNAKDRVISLFVDGKLVLQSSANQTYGSATRTIYTFGDGMNATFSNVEFHRGAIMVPEPTTATLSLLALCGLAARRRRK